MRRDALVLCALLATATAAPGAPPVSASEIGALHLAFEKPVKMRRVRARLYLPYFDYTRSAKAGEPFACAALPSGAAGRLPATGDLRLRLLAGGAGEPWESEIVARALDARGEAGFTAEEIATLAGDAPAGTAIELFEIELRGGKGRKVKTLILDCERQGAE